MRTANSVIMVARAMGMEGECGAIRDMERGCYDSCFGSAQMHLVGI
jgi:hypothetical protein